MRLAGFLLLLAGWAIVLAALVVLGQIPARTAFVVAGLAVEAIGLVIVVRSHAARRGYRA